MEDLKNLYTTTLQRVQNLGLVARNWSTPGELVFAVYSEGDSYMGQIASREGKMVVLSAYCKADRRILEGLCK